MTFNVDPPLLVLPLLVLLMPALLLPPPPHPAIMVRNVTHATKITFETLFIVAPLFWRLLPDRSLLAKLNGLLYAMVQRPY
jgi:hypothetical protein